MTSLLGSTRSTGADHGIVIRRRTGPTGCLAGALAILAGALSLGTATAHADESTAKKRNCSACHTLDRKLVGPAFREVATRYASDRDAEARLARRIREGGTGAWGTLAMPPQPTIPEAEARDLARWVLSLK